jgi:hypothetical protein
MSRVALQKFHPLNPLFFSIFFTLKNLQTLSHSFLWETALADR